MRHWLLKIKEQSEGNIEIQILRVWHQYSFLLVGKSCECSRLPRTAAGNTKRALNVQTGATECPRLRLA